MQKLDILLESMVKETASHSLNSTGKGDGRK